MTDIITTNEEAELVAILLSHAFQRDVQPAEVVSASTFEVVGALAENWERLDDILRRVAAPIIERAKPTHKLDPYRETRFLTYVRELRAALGRDATIADASRMFNSKASPKRAAEFLRIGLKAVG